MTAKEKRDITWLIGAPDKPNLAVELGDDELGVIGQEVVRTYELDKRERADWDLLSDTALKLAKQIKEPKNFPWQGCANVKHPLITVAGIQFAARAYPEICKMGQVVKCLITGDEPTLSPPPGPPPGGAAPPVPMLGAPSVPPGPSAPPGPPGLTAPGTGMGGVAGPPAPIPGAVAGPLPGGPPPAVPNVPGVVGPPLPTSPKRERADRIEIHMNYQLTQEMPEWDPDTDRLLHILPVIGQLYRKTYFSGIEGRNISELVLPSDCVVNKKARAMEKARRVTHSLWFYENDVWERVRSNTWLEPDHLQPPPTEAGDDPDAASEFLEQHCYLDLDGDKYKEPYIVTVQRATSKVVRIVARWQPENVEPARNGKKIRVGKIKADQYFTHYGFIPNPDGSMNYLGFGQLLANINETTNTVLNQLLDAGTLYNAGGGFVGRGARMRGGIMKTAPGIWQFVDVAGQALKDSLVPMPVKEPSTVLFQLLGFLVQAGKEISSVQDILTGDAKLAANMPVGTAMALVEQGLKVFTAIYKRIYRSLTEEFKKLYQLNAQYLDPSFTFYISGRETAQVIGQRDYQIDDVTVVPVADPSLSSDMQRMLKAQALKDLSGRPGLNEVEISRRLVRAINPENMEQILLSDAQISGTVPLPWKPPPPPQMVVAQAKAQRLMQQAQEANVRLMMDKAKFMLELTSLQADIANTKADTMLKLATAADKGRADLMEFYKMEMDRLAKDVENKIKLVQESVAAAAGPPGGGPGGPQRPTPGPRRGAAPAPGPAGAAGPMGAAGPAEVGGMIPGMQEGGPVAAGRPVVVGEAGREKFVPTAAPFTRDPLYDYESAARYGIKPDPVTRHWSSRVPAGPKEGLLLKSENHPTFYKTLETEKEGGYTVYRNMIDGRLYSFPSDKKVSSKYIPYEDTQTQ